MSWWRSLDGLTKLQVAGWAGIVAVAVAVVLFLSSK